jgi:hypothetical protein
MSTRPSAGPVQAGGYQRYTSPGIHVEPDTIIEKGPVAFFEKLHVLAEDLKAH